MIKILMGGSPCTHWSIAQVNNRETEPRGEGWELFRNYLIAKEKFAPDFFLYENNKSAAPAIKQQISKDLQTDLMYINSALVSAQSRERFYAFSGGFTPPTDRGILLQDILESGIADRDKAYCLKHQAGNARDYFKKHHTQIAFEPITELAKIPSMIVNEATSKGYAEIAPGDCVDLSYEHSKTRRGRSMKYKCNCLTTSCNYYQYCGTVDKPIYRITNNTITYAGKQYPVKLKDGCYIIRKLTPIECERLQTLPDDYTAGISDTQRYKCLGNGWTAEVIIYILRHILKDIPRNEKLLVLSMYDGIATGRYCLEQLGFTDVEYHAYEIDKYALQVASKNYPDIIQHGDAFSVRHSDWRIL